MRGSLVCGVPLTNCWIVSEPRSRRKSGGSGIATSMARRPRSERRRSKPLAASATRCRSATPCPTLVASRLALLNRKCKPGMEVRRFAGLTKLLIRLALWLLASSVFARSLGVRGLHLYLSSVWPCSALVLTAAHRTHRRLTRTSQANRREVTPQIATIELWDRTRSSHPTGQDHLQRDRRESIRFERRLNFRILRVRPPLREGGNLAGEELVSERAPRLRSGGWNAKHAESDIRLACIRVEQQPRGRLRERLLVTIGTAPRHSRV